MDRECENNILIQLAELRRLMIMGVKNVLSVEDLCLLLDTTRNNIYRMTSEKKIPFYKPLRGKIFFKREEIEAWLLRNRSASLDEIESKATTLNAI